MGKSSGQTIGYWYRVAYHAGLCVGPIDAFLEFRCGDQVAWSGEITASTRWHIEKRNLFGGEKDQGGISSDVEILFGDAAQAPSVYLRTLGQYLETSDGSLLPYLQSMTPSAPPADPTGKVPAWRGMTTFVFRGGYYGAMNPYPQKPSYKVRRITNWNGVQCWYPEKAEVLLDSSVASQPGYFLVPRGQHVINVNGTTTYDCGPVDASFIGTAEQIGAYCVNAWNATFGSNYTPAGGYLWQRTDGSRAISGYSAELGPFQGVANVDVTPVCEPGYTPTFVAHGPASNGITNPTIVCQRAPALHGMNPAHILYYARTQPDMGREPTSSISDASFRTGADWFHDQGIGLCTTYDPSQESVDDFIARIEKVSGCSVNRSLVDGLWYLDIANGVYDLASLPILTDDDILEFLESPITHDSAPNSMAVEYFDPQQKQTITTPPVQAMALIDTLGPIEQVQRYPEIPTASLATRIVQRDLLGSVTPGRSFDLVTTRKPYAWRQNTYFRLRSVKRGIADMVCLIAEKSDGTLKSGAIKLTAAQDIYSLPTTSFVGVETSIDSRPPQIPPPIADEVAFEAPYIDVVQRLSRADLAALPTDAGYLMSVAADPGQNRDFDMTVSSDGIAFTDVGSSAWTPSALIVEGDDLKAGLKTSFTFTQGIRLDQVAVGSAALWRNTDGTDEICRVDAIDAGAGTLTLGRGCADTVVQVHAAGSRIWFYQTAVAADATEYAAGETMQVALLTNSFTQQLDEALATRMPVTLDYRQYRPYPPGNLRINGSDYPSGIVDALQLDWSARDRVQQADQLIDAAQADVGPEAGTTWELLLYDETDTLKRTISDVTAETYTWTSEQQDCQISGGATVVDPFAAQVVSLLPCDGPDGSTVFTDAISGRVWTPAGGAKMSAAQPIFGGTSGSFGTGYLTSGSTTFWQFLHDGTTKWTIDAWVRVNALGTSRGILGNNQGSSDFSGLGLWIDPTGKMRVFMTRSDPTFGSPLNWTSASAVVAAGGAFALISVQFDPTANGNLGALDCFVNGTLVAHVAANGHFLNNAPTYAMNIGALGGGALPLDGNESNIRITKALRYSGDFVPPSGPWLSGSTYRYNGRIRAQLRSARDGLTSRQQHDVIILRAGYGLNYGYFYGGDL